MLSWLLPVTIGVLGITLSLILYVYPEPLLILPLGVLASLSVVLLFLRYQRNLHHLNEYVDEQTEMLQQNISALETANRELERQNEYDYLTGLYNRGAFSKKLEVALAKARRLHFNIAVLFLDLTGFKHINNTLGYTAGDILLQQTGKHLQAVCSDEVDLVARLGGDKFVMLFKAMNETAAVTRVNALFELFNRTPLKIDKRVVPLKLSVGISLASGNEKAEILLKRAESAVLQAKQKTGNAYAVQHQDKQINTDRLTLENELQQALEEYPEQIKVFFQPKRHMIKNTFGNPETLVRWIHPERGFISPGQFIPLAEETGLIVKLGELVLRKACQEAISWTNPLQVAVNFSPRQFMEPDIVERVASILQETGLPPQRLIMEITESMVMPESNDKLAQFVDIGIQLSIDDFGTGYSNLSSLQKSLISELKIDRSFVLDMVDNPQSLALVQGILCLAHKLKLRVVAEGVENIEQAALLRKFRCDYIQGYLYCKPLPSERFAQLKFVNQMARK